jgi:phosphoglucosamine mutase
MPVTAPRKLFGTDGVRGVAGADLTASLARRLGAAGARFAGHGGRVLIGRDTRESGVWLEAALVEGIVAAGGRAQSAGVIPTPGVAVLSRGSQAALGAVISASHNPYQDNGIKFLGGDGRKLTDADERRIEELVGDENDASDGSAETVQDAAGAYVDWLAATYGDGVPAGAALAVDCGNGAAHAVAPVLMARLGVDAQAIGVSPDGRNINDGVGSTHLDAVARLVGEGGLAGGIAFDGDADRCLAVDSRGRTVNGDAIVAVLAIDRHRRGLLDEDRVVVTSMTNMGFHKLMRESGIALEVTDVGDRYVLERMTATGATLGGEQSGHIVDLVHHTTGDGLATALMLLAALQRLGMTLDDAAELVVPFPQKLVAVAADRSRLTDAARVWQEVDAAAAKLGQDGRVVVRASGTEPVVRVMVEAADGGECEAICDHLCVVVREQIGV